MEGESMSDILEFLRSEGVSERILKDVEDFRQFYRLKDGCLSRIPVPQYHYYGKEIWEEALSTILAGENLSGGRSGMFRSILIRTPVL